MTRLDYEREMMFVALPQSGPHAGEIAGEVRAFRYPDSTTAEVSVLVRSDLQQRGLGRALLAKMLRYCRGAGVTEVIGRMLPDNAAMIALARRCGMEVQPVESAGVAVAHIDLRSRATAELRKPSTH
jgi:acetyltransferase